MFSGKKWQYLHCSKTHIHTHTYSVVRLPPTFVCEFMCVSSIVITMDLFLLLCPLCSLPSTPTLSLLVLFVCRSRVCPPSPLRTPVLPPPPPPQPLPLPPEPAGLTSPAGAHRVSGAGLPPGRHHASVCLTHATPLGYCFPAATHHIDP